MESLNLEKTLQGKDYKKNIKFIVDTGTSVALSFGSGMFHEYVLVGMSLEQTLTSRFVSIVPTLLTGGIYGTYRDFLIEQTRKHTSLAKTPSKLVANVLAYTTFQLPIYAATLAIAGTDYVHGKEAVRNLLFLSPFLGVIYGISLDQAREKSGICPSSSLEKTL